MALTRSALREKGITEKEILDYIMEEHGNTVEAAKEKAADKANDAAKIKIDALQAIIDAAPQPDGEDWKSKFDDEVTAHQKTKDTHTAEQEAADTDGKVAAALKAAGMNEKAIPKALKLYDRAIVEKGKDGALANTEKVVEAFKGEWGDFFGTEIVKGTDPATPPTGGTVYGSTLQELMEAANKNPDKLGEIMSQVETLNKKKE